MTEKQHGLLLVNHLFIRASFVIRHLSFVISFAWLRIGNFAIAGLISKPQKLEGKTCFTSFGTFSSASSWVVWPRRSCICIYRSHGQSCSVLSARLSAAP